MKSASRRARRLAAGLGCLLLAPLLRSQEPVEYVSPPETLPRSVSPQPVAFSHKIHVGAGVECLDCHPTAAKKARAGFPDFKDCMLCHQTIATDRPEVRKLMLLTSQKMKVKWVRVYEVPEFVFFHHRKHMAADLQCADCHGPVETRDVLAQELSVSMTACMNCHAERGVANHCYYCHDLGQ